MLYTVDTRNINTAVRWGLEHLLHSGIEEESRNGKVLVAPGPVCTIYNNPKERILFSPARDANPFFHLFEALWMLAGRNDLDFPRQFNKRFREYSDDGSIVWGAYGWRWRDFFNYDQLAAIIDELKKNPTSRRCVLAMWNGMHVYETERSEYLPIESDLCIARKGGKDVPCNTHAYFDVRGGMLNMTVCNRSNDAIWGAYGANVVHFSLLQEYMAEQIGVNVGLYYQFSNNFHAYLDIYNREALEKIADEAGKSNMYNIWPAMTKNIPLGSTQRDWHEDLGTFLNGGQAHPTRESFFTRIAAPMYDAWFLHKDGDSVAAMDRLKEMPECDWKFVAVGWVERRMKGKENAA